MAKRLRIALLIESSRQYGRGLLQGIAAYARTYGPWFLYHTERTLGDAAPAGLEKWRGDGVIARIESRQLIYQIRNLGLPTVDMLGKHKIDGVPVVRPDDRHTAQLAFEHLRQRGLSNFAYCGFAGVYYSDLRQQYFVQHVEAAGYRSHVYVGPTVPSRTHIASIELRSLTTMDALANWLRSLPKPIGIMTCNDLRAQQVLNICGVGDIRTPEEVAVIGVDNDEMVCQLSTPPLSSVRLNTHKIGYEAAALLDRMMRGESPPKERILVESTGVQTRQSTAVQSTDDPDVADALQFIREHACEGISVDDVLQGFPHSHSTLVRHFTKAVGRSPKAEIVRVRLERVKELLAITSLPLTEIAQLTSFNYVENMCKLFKQKIGQTPGQYRQRLGPPAVTE